MPPKLFKPGDDVPEEWLYIRPNDKGVFRKGSVKFSGWVDARMEGGVLALRALSGTSVLAIREFSNTNLSFALPVVFYDPDGRMLAEAGLHD